MFTGHFPYVASDMLDLDLVRLTLLREPVERTVSVLKHFKRLSKRVQELPLEEIYDDPFVFSRFIQNHQAMMFSVTEEDKPEAFGSPMTYWATATLLRMHTTEQNEETEAELQRAREIASASAPEIDAVRLRARNRISRTST